LGRFNHDLEKVNHAEADAAWNASVRITGENEEILSLVQKFKEEWRDAWCDRVDGLDAKYVTNALSTSARRQLWLMCRGPRFSNRMTRSFESIRRRLYALYHTSVACVGHDGGECLHGEPDLARVMETERDPEKLLRVWARWRDAAGAGEKGKALYRDMVGIMNEAATNNGYGSVADAWKEALEISNVERKIEELYAELLPFYQLLHGYVRHRLRQFYGTGYVSDVEPIPAHLLGNMWAQTWSTISDIVEPAKSASEESPAAPPPRSLTELLQDRNYQVMDIVRASDSYYQSLGLAPMTDEFYARSQFMRPVNKSKLTSCHPSAINMFSGNDFRIEMCGDQSEETFFTIHHEMGHVQYYMNYAQLPTIFRDGANPAFHEAVGDSVNYGVHSPAHLKRLDLWDSNSDDIRNLLQQALYRIPLIPWSLVVDTWRWHVFEGRIKYEDWNTHWWHLRESLQGVKSPVPRGEHQLDPLAKFHVPDNTPYMPYFLSGFLQVQFFEAMCEADHGGDYDLHKCDLYNSKRAGSRLRSMLELGVSKPWKAALEAMTGSPEISARPLLRYYAPLIAWLERRVEEENIPIGW